MDEVLELVLDELLELAVVASEEKALLVEALKEADLVVEAAAADFVEWAVMSTIVEPGYEFKIVVGLLKQQSWPWPVVPWGLYTCTIPTVGIAVAASAAVADKLLVLIATNKAKAVNVNLAEEENNFILAKQVPRHEFAGKVLSVQVPSAKKVLSRYWQRPLEKELHPETHQKLTS